MNLNTMFWEKNQLFDTPLITKKYNILNMALKILI